MENKGDFTKILAWAGTILAWFPILAVILIFAPGTAPSGMPPFYYVWPAAPLGPAMLLWAASRARSRRRLIGRSLAAALVLFGGGPVLAGLGFYFRTDSEGKQVAQLLTQLALAGLAGFAFAYILMGVGGILLLRDLYRQEPAAQAA